MKRDEAREVGRGQRTEDLLVHGQEVGFYASSSGKLWRSSIKGII